MENLNYLSQVPTQSPKKTNSIERKLPLDQNISNEIVKWIVKNNQNIIKFFWSWRPWIEIKSNSFKQMGRWADGKLIYFWIIWLKYLDWITPSKQTWVFVNEDWDPMNIIVATSNNWSTYISNFWLQLSKSEFINAPLNSLKDRFADILFSAWGLYLWEYMNSRWVKSYPKDLNLKIMKLIKSLPAQSIREDLMWFMRVNGFENAEEFKRWKNNLFKFLDAHRVYEIK